MEELFGGVERAVEHERGERGRRGRRETERGQLHVGLQREQLH